jgi:hypothetical protein
MSQLGTEPALIDDFWRSAFSLADVQNSQINFSFRHYIDLSNTKCEG